MSTTLFATSHVLSANKEDEPPMTMHVGMAGSDGIVLAGDTLESASPKADSIASRYLREAYPLADGIITDLSSEFWQYPETRMCEIARSYATSRPRWRDVQCMILLSEPMPALYLLECSVDERTNELLSPLCRRVPLYAFAGDALNGAIYWAMRYCRTLSPEMRTLPRLARLAAQIIADAGTLNSASIAGLEVVQCDSAGIHRLTSSENETLLQEAQQRSNQIQRLIIGE